MTEWPIKRRCQSIQSPEIPTETLLLAFHTDAITRGNSFRMAVDALMQACQAKSDPKDTISRLNELSNSSQLDESESSWSSSDVILVMACVEVFRKVPAAETWHYLWSLAWHHSILAQELPRAIITIAKDDLAFKTSFLKIALAAVKDGTAEPKRRATVNEQKLISQLCQDWKEKPSLIKIWWGLREASSITFSDDDGLFRIIADLDLEVFTNLLSQLDNPYWVQAALQSAGAGWSFSRWQNLFSLAPAAFDDNRNWNGSVIAPLLLVVARDQILQEQFGIRVNVSENVLEKTKIEIQSLAKEIAVTVAAHPNANPCAERWATWLMRQSIGEIANDSIPYPIDARSHGYVDTILIKELGAAIREINWNLLPADDAEPWESWCYRCVLVSIASANDIPMPSVDDFLDQWSISPEDWRSDRGESLRARATIFETFGKRADAYGTRLLAISLFETNGPQLAWERIWNATEVIREIVEFGDSDEEKIAGLSGEAAASGLMKLVFGLGLMMLDCLVDSNCKTKCDRQSSLKGLLTILFDSVKEMSAIDKFNRKYWSEAIRHLAIRRAVWVDAAQSLAVAFDKYSKPLFSDFIRELSGDTEVLLALLEVALKNGVKHTVLRQALDEADINLSVQINFADRLIALDRKRVGISTEQLTEIRSLL